MTTYKRLVETIIINANIKNVNYKTMSVKECRQFLTNCSNGTYGEKAKEEYKKL